MRLIFKRGRPEMTSGHFIPWFAAACQVVNTSMEPAACFFNTACSYPPNHHNSSFLLPHDLHLPAFGSRKEEDSTTASHATLHWDLNPLFRPFITLGPGVSVCALPLFLRTFLGLGRAVWRRPHPYQCLVRSISPTSPNSDHNTEYSCRPGERRVMGLQTMAATFHTRRRWRHLSLFLS